MENQILQIIEETFNRRGREKYGTEPVTQLQHALQCANLAEQNQAPKTLIAAAFLHDFGHIMHEEALPTDATQNYDDRHEEKAYDWLLTHFGPAVADPVKFHVMAKRYLCTNDKSYLDKLSPTSQKSFIDQGGFMNEDELEAFKSEAHFDDAVRLRIWDDLAKDSDGITPPMMHFLQIVEGCLIG